MSKRRFYFHIVLLLAALAIGSWSLWLDGIVTAGRNYPNLTALAMVFLVIGQVLQLKAYQHEKKKNA